MNMLRSQRFIGDLNDVLDVCNDGSGCVTLQTVRIHVTLRSMESVAGNSL